MKRKILTVVLFLGLFTLFVAAISSVSAADSPLTSHLSAVWANEGGDKVTQDELRATSDPNAVLNSAWDGSAITLFGARNEAVSFNLVLEAANADAPGVDVSLTALTGPGGATITTRPASGDDLFDYRGRNIELFYVRYLEIKGLSVDLSYEAYYDERHVPERCRRPNDGQGNADPNTGWNDRPCHNKFYPEIAVPLELQSPFTITAGDNQSIWGDIYIPKSAPAGIYTGTVEIKENGSVTRQVPIRLKVRDFSLPDLPSARTMLYVGWEDINDRYLGEKWPDSGTITYTRAITLSNRHHQIIHRHKISTFDSYTPPAEMDEVWTDRLSGALFTPARGYDGVGVGVGNNIYSIGTYGDWPWQSGDEADMRTNSDAWVNWFDAHPFATPTEYFLYLIDESTDYPRIEQWSQWVDDNPGPGQRLMTMATLDLPAAETETPSLDVAVSGAPMGVTDVWQAAADRYTANPAKRFYGYNGRRPMTGSWATEDDGVAPRTLAWGAYKKKMDRWLVWESTYYTNFQCYGYTDPKTFTDLFHQAQTFGCYGRDDPSIGRAGWNYTNGDGVLLYPGVDTRYPADSYGVMGPFASLRLKHWRRGIQDVDYLTLAAAIDPERVAEIVDEIIPKVMWEYGVDEPSDPTYVRTDISWSTDPDDWEAARAELADIIEGGGATAGFLVDHTKTDLAIPAIWIAQAKAILHIAYEHTSHGSQLITGMNALKDYPDFGDKYAWSDTTQGNSDSLSLDDYGIPNGPNDLSQGDDDRNHNGIVDWADSTYNYLVDPDHYHVNVILWSWCNIAGHDIEFYLNGMEWLIGLFGEGGTHPRAAEHPVKFVFITAHANGGGEGDSSDSQNELIRAHTTAHNRILFDFSDMENYDPDENYYLDKLLQDDLDYDSDGNGWVDANWAVEYLDRHDDSELDRLTTGNNVPGYGGSGSCAHSDGPGNLARLNCVLKGRAAWHLFARLAGWDGQLVENNLLAAADDAALHLSWDPTGVLPAGVTWRISYAGPAGDQPSPITGIPLGDRGYTLTGLTNGAAYTITLEAMLDGTAYLPTTAIATPTSNPVFLPLITATKHSASDLRLTWSSPAGYVRYQVWRGDSPYFGLSGAMAGEITTAPWQFDDGGALGDPAENHYYRVVGIKNDGGATVSARVGGFDFGVTAGD